MIAGSRSTASRGSAATSLRAYAARRDLPREMLLIRRFEEKVEERFRAGELAGFLHACIGQEAVAVGVCRALEDGDVIGSTHRAHGHLLANGNPVDGDDLDELRVGAEVALDATLREAIPDVGDVTIERRVVEGRPAAILIEESRGADLLVVGSRGHGGFAGLLLGSVSQQCANQEKCPVLIVRAPSGDSGLE